MGVNEGWLGGMGFLVLAGIITVDPSTGGGGDGLHSGWRGCAGLRRTSCFNIVVVLPVFNSVDPHDHSHACLDPAPGDI
jgi:hypothetical protein